MSRNNQDLMGSIIVSCVLITLATILILSVISDRKRNETENWAYRRNYNVPCEVVTSDAFEGGVFKDRIVRTPKHRFEVHEQDDIVVGDSVCLYDFNNVMNGKVVETHSSNYSVKNKDVMLYSN